MSLLTWRAGLRLQCHVRLEGRPLGCGSEHMANICCHLVLHVDQKKLGALLDGGVWEEA
jgi:hypothetical protein